MATMAADKVMVDTNVLVHATVSTSPWHHRARTALPDLQATGKELWVSRQILREYLPALSRPQTCSQPQVWATLAADVEQLERQLLVDGEDEQVTAALLALGQIVPVGGKQVHDANIVATMMVHGITTIVTFNAADFSRFARQVTVTEPA